MMRPCLNAGQSSVSVSYSPPSPHTLQPNLSLRLRRCGCSWAMDLPRCLCGSRPRAATCQVVRSGLWQRPGRVCQQLAVSTCNLTLPRTAHTAWLPVGLPVTFTSTAWMLVLIMSESSWSWGWCHR
jgi:hypothetical protein